MHHRTTATALLTGVLVSIGVWVMFTDEGAPTSESATSSAEDAYALERDPSVLEHKLQGKARRLANGGKKKPQHPGGIAQERFDQRADENGELAPTALIEAKAHLDAMRTPSRDGGLWDWDWLGPGNIGGRVRAIVTDPGDPDHLLIGSVAGGVWRSTNRGASWTPINDFMPSLAVTCMVRDPQTPTTLFLGTGEGFGNFDALPGAGIFRSTNDGNTWSNLSSTTNWDFVNRLAVRPDDSRVIFAAVVDGGVGRIYRTVNGGSTWGIVLNTTGRALDVKIDPNNGNRVLVGSDGAVYYSTDGGTNWTEETVDGNKLPSDGGRCEVTFTVDVSTMFVSIERNQGEIWRSKDGGNTWQLRNTGDNYLGGQGWYNNAIWVDPSTANALVVGGIDLWRSADGGATLTKVSDWRDYHNPGNSAHADNHIIVPASDYFQTKRMYVGNDGGIQTVVDILSTGQNNWTNLANGLGITQFYGAASSPDGSIIVGGAQDNDHLRFTGGVNSWYQAETGDGGYAAVDPTDSDIIYSEFVRLQIEKSTDGGDTYNNVVNGLGDAGDGNNALFIAPFRLDVNDPDVLIAGGSSIWRTTDGAANWSSVRSPVPGTPLCSAMEISPGDSDYWVGYTNGRVSRSTNSGTSWTDVDNNGVGLPNRWVTDIAVSPSNENHIMVVFGGYQVSNVWFSSNGGTSWEDRSGTAPFDVPAIQVNTVAFHPANPNWVYIGTDLGVLASEDLGLNWNVTPLYEGNEGPANTEVSDLFFYGGEYLVAATHGRGMYRSRPLSVVFVDKAASPGGDGSSSNPFETVAEAESMRGPGATVSIESATYGEGPITLGTRGRYVATGGLVRIQ